MTSKYVCQHCGQGLSKLNEKCPECGVSSRELLPSLNDKQIKGVNPQKMFR